MTIESVRIYYHPEDPALELRLTQTHWGFATWFKRRLKPMREQLRGAEVKGVNIVNFVLFEAPWKAWRLNEWGRRDNSFEFDSLYELHSLTAQVPLDNIRMLMRFTSEIALRAPWPQVAAIGRVLAVPLSAEEEQTLLPYLCWPRSEI